jgi:hypothetical protein
MTRIHCLPCVLASVLVLAFVATALSGASANPCVVNMKLGTTQRAQDFFFAVSPFDLTRLGVFVSP